MKLTMEIRDEYVSGLERLADQQGQESVAEYLWSVLNRALESEFEAHEAEDWTGSSPIADLRVLDS